MNSYWGCARDRTGRSGSRAPNVSRPTPPASQELDRARVRAGLERRAIDLEHVAANGLHGEDHDTLVRAVVDDGVVDALEQADVVELHGADVPGRAVVDFGVGVSPRTAGHDRRDRVRTEQVADAGEADADEADA